MTPDKYLAARKDGNLAVLEGFHTIKHALRFNVEIIDIATPSKQSILQLCEKSAPDIGDELKKRIREVDEEEFKSFTPYELKTPVIALARRKNYQEGDVFDKEGIIVWLDNPKNHENVGAIIRLVAGLGGAGVVITGDMDVWNPGVIRGAAGLHFAVAVLKTTKNPWDFSRELIVFDENGQSINDVSIPKQSIIVFGSERYGVAEQIKSQAVLQIRIPMSRNVSSLNLATSVAVALWEIKSS